MFKWFWTIFSLGAPDITKSCLPTVNAQSLLDNKSSRIDDNNFWKDKIKMLKISK